MGVSGCGKSTVAAALAQRLHIPYADADDFHPPANVAKMSAGTPLTDEDRVPWLATLANWLVDQHGEGASLACSALKRTYRDQLRTGNPQLFFVHLHGTREVITARVTGRPGHFMPSSLVDSQFATLELLGDDEPGCVLDIDQPVDQLVNEAAQAVTDYLAV